MDDEIGKLMRDPAYTDGKHPHHYAQVAKVANAYRARNGEPPLADTSTNDAMRRIEENPAYRYRHHPYHAGLVDQMSAIYRAMPQS